MKLLILLFAFVFFCSNTFSQKVKLHSIVEQTIDDDKKQAIKVWEKLLYSLDEVERRELWNVYEKTNSGVNMHYFNKFFFNMEEKKL